MRSMFWSAVAFGILAGAAARAEAATPIPINNGTFETPGATNGGVYSYPAPGWMDSDAGKGAIGEFVETAYGLNGNPPGSSPDPDGGNGGAYIAGAWMAQQIGTLNTSAIYTINFSLSTDGSATSTTVELVDGSPTGSVLASFPQTGSPNTWSAYSPALIPDPLHGSNGDPLFLEFVHTSGGQSFVDGVTASYSAPEPACIGLLSLAGLTLLARRRNA